MTAPRPDACGNQHAAPPLPEARAIDWGPSQSRVNRVRVRAHTCCCTSPYFELCTAGGLWFIRRYTKGDPTVPGESPWLLAAAAQELWTQLLTGQVR